MKPSFSDLTEHGHPTTRREFIARGLAAGGTLLFLPSLVSQLVRESLAEDSIGKGPAFICIDLAGGANLLGTNFMVGDLGGQRDLLPEAAYFQLGLLKGGLSSAIPGNPLTAQGRHQIPHDLNLNDELGVLLHPDSGILSGIKETTSSTDSPLKNVDGMTFCSQSQDDSPGNPFNPSYWIAAAGANGSLTSLIKDQTTADPLRLGNSSNGGGSESPRFAPSAIQTALDCRGLVELEDLKTLTSSEKNFQEIQKKTFGFISRLSEASFRRFSELNFSQQLKTTTGEVYRKLAQSDGGSSSIDPDQDPVLSSIFSDDRISLLDQNGQAGLGNRARSIAKLLADGYAGAATFTLGGFDYHGQTLAQCKNRELQVGRLIGSLLEVFKAKQKSVLIYLYTDGGVASDATGKFVSDAGNKGGSALLLYNPRRSKGSTESSSFLQPGSNRQIGAYQFKNGSTGVNPSAAITSVNGISNQARVVLANYLALRFPDEQKVRQELRKISGSDPIPRGEFKKYVPFKTI